MSDHEHSAPDCFGRCEGCGLRMESPSRWMRDHAKAVGGEIVSMRKTVRLTAGQMASATTEKAQLANSNPHNTFPPMSDEPNQTALTPVSEEEFRRLLIEHGHIQPWEPTPSGAFYCPPKPLLPPQP